MQFMAKLKYLIHNVPAPVRIAAESAAVAGGAAFLATFKPLIPALVGTPSMSATKAALLTAAAAGLAAAYHAAKGSIKTLAAKWAAIPVPSKAPPAA